MKEKYDETAKHQEAITIIRFFLFIQKNSRIFNIAKRHSLLKLFIKRYFA
jgi:hypothetical protein